jgi:dTMP kinase
MSTGHFITFEGGEGVGKSTQIARLALHLETSSKEVVTTREPGGSPLGERIRELLLDPGAENRSALTETLLFCAARSDHIERIITPALERCAWVLCDRFSDSTRAYQGTADGVSDDVLSMLEKIVLSDVAPNLTILLDLPVGEGLKRVQARAHSEKQGAQQDQFERRSTKFHERLRQGFLEIAAREPNRVIIFDAAKSPDVLDAEIWSTVSDRFGLS